MSHRARTTALLVIAAGVVGALVWWDQRRPSTDEARAAHGKILPGFDRGRARAISVQHAGVVTTLTHEGDAWLVDGKGRADADAVEALLGALEFGSVERRLRPPDAATRAQLGLAAPKTGVTVDGVSLKIGAADPSGRAVYVLRGDEPEVLVVEHRLLEVTDLPAGGFRAQGLVTTALESVHALAYGALSVSSDGAGWKVGAMRADAAKVDALLDTLRRAHARRVIETAPHDGGTALLVDGRIEARVIGPCPAHVDEQLVARADGTLLCFAADELKPLAGSPLALREARPFSRGLDQVSAVHVQRDKQELTVLRQAGQWRITVPRERAGLADDGLVRAWVGRLLQTHASGFGPPGARRGELRLDNDRCVIGERDGLVTLQRDGEPEALLVDRAFLDEASVDADRLRDRVVLRFRLDQLKTKLTPPLAELLSSLRVDAFALALHFTPVGHLHLELSTGAAHDLTWGPPEKDDGRCPARLVSSDAPPSTFYLPAVTCPNLR